MINREVLNDGLVTFLGTATGKQIGLADVPNVTPTLPYAILWPMNTSGSPETFADYGNPQEWLFQVTNVGTDPRQCAWMSTKICKAFVLKGTGGKYTNAITISGLSVWSRVCDGLGAIMRSGDDLYQSADSYRLRIEET